MKTLETNFIIKDKYMEELKGNVSSIETTGFLDGPGLRVMVFLQGCPLRCLYCHNPENLQCRVEKNLMTPQQVFERIKRYKPYFEHNGGVTFSGGEPLLQPDFVRETIKLCKAEGIHTAVDTSGAVENFESALDVVDLVILDIKACTRELYKQITGLEIDKFDKFLAVCQQKKKPLWLRQVIIPGINDTKEYISMLAEYIAKIDYVEKVELLPYHNMAKSKYTKLNFRYRLEGTPNMDKTLCKHLENLLIEQIQKIRNQSK